MLDLKYSVAIRTLGTSGEKYLNTLKSLSEQSIRPEGIIVYIAEGYELPTETIGIEKYVYVKKGMVAQRALPYDEIDSEYILFSDDDVYYPPTAVEEMYKQMRKNHGDVIAPDPFPHDKLPISVKFAMLLFLSSVPHIFEKKTGYSRSWWGGQKYRNRIRKEVYESTTNAGMCFLCKKSDFRSIHFEEDLWMDKLPYAVGDDNLMFYRMHKNGLRVLTWYNYDIRHLDAGSSTRNMSETKRQIQSYCLAYHNYVFWWTYCYKDKNKFEKPLRLIGFSVIKAYQILVSLIFNIIKRRPKVAISGIKGLKDAMYAVSRGKLSILR